MLCVTCDNQHKRYNAECHHAELAFLIVMLNVIMLIVIVLNVIMLSVVMFSVVMLSVVVLNVVMMIVVASMRGLLQSAFEETKNMTTAIVAVVSIGSFTRAISHSICDILDPETHFSG